MLVFPDLLKAYLTAAGLSVSQLAREAGLPRRTIANWLEGYAQKPRYWNDVLKLASTLHLDRLATDDLLVSAGFPTTAALRSRHPENMLLPLWADAHLANTISQHVLEIIGESGGALFQNLPLVKAVYLLQQALHLAELMGDTRYFCHLTLDLASCLIALARYEAAANALHKAIDLAEREEQFELIMEARALLISVQTFAKLETSDLDYQKDCMQVALQQPLPIRMRLRALYSLGLWATHTQRFDEAQAYYHQICRLTASDATYVLHRLSTLNNLGELAIRQQNYASADTLLSQALAISTTSPSSYASPYIHANLGVVKMRGGDYVSAESQFEVGIQLATAIEDQRVIFILHLNRAELALHCSDEPRALSEFQAALVMCDEDSFHNAKLFLTYCLERLKKGQGKYLLRDPYYRSALDNLIW